MLWAMKEAHFGVYILINAITIRKHVGSVSILINTQAMKGAYVRRMHPNQRKGGR